MHIFRKVAFAAAITSLALPAVAAAHERPSPKSVAKHVRSADQALEMVSSLVADNEQAAAAVEFVRNRRQTQRAGREANQLRKRGAKAGRTARSVRRVARQRNENAEVYSDLVDEVEGRLQTGMAHTVNTDLRGREKALSVLTDLAARLPERAQVGISRAIAALSSDGGDEVASLSEALESGALGERAEAAVDAALARATAAIENALERLGELVPTLPEQAQPHVQKAIDRIGGIVPMVQGILDGIFGGGNADQGGAQLPGPRGIRIPAGPFS